MVVDLTKQTGFDFRGNRKKDALKQQKKLTTTERKLIASRNQEVMRDLLAQGKTVAQIAKEFRARGIKTRNGSYYTKGSLNVLAWKMRKSVRVVKAKPTSAAPVKAPVKIKHKDDDFIVTNLIAAATKLSKLSIKDKLALIGTIARDAK